MAKRVSSTLVALGIILLLGSLHVPAEGQEAQMVMVLGVDTSPPSVTIDEVKFGGQRIDIRSGTVTLYSKELIKLFEITATAREDSGSWITSIELRINGVLKAKEERKDKPKSVTKTFSFVALVWLSEGEHEIGVVARNKDGRGNYVYFKVIVSDKRIFTLSISCAPREDAGKVDPQPGVYSIKEGDFVTIRAEPNSGWNWVRFKDGAGGTLTTEKTYQFVMDSNKTIIAEFSKITGVKYTVNVTVNPPGSGSVKVDYRGEPYYVFLEAYPATGYEFVNWSDGNNCSSRYIYDLSSNLNLTANFRRKGAPRGTLWINNERAISTLFLKTRKLNFCFEAERESRELISEVVLKIRGPVETDIPLKPALLGVGKWEGVFTLEKDGTYTISCDVRWTFGTVTVASLTFGGQEKVPPGYVKIEYICYPRNGGVIVGCKSPVPKGTPIEIQAFANKGFKFVGWKGDVPKDYDSYKLGFFAMDNMQIIAVFEPTERFVLSTAQVMRIFGGLLIFAGGVSWLMERRRWRYG